MLFDKNRFDAIFVINQPLKNWIFLFNQMKMSL